jgi:hypothetical protein
MMRIVSALIDRLFADDARHDKPDLSAPAAGTFCAVDRFAIDPKDAADRLWRQQMHMKTADAFDDKDETDD